MVKLLFLAALYIGRIDTPFVADKVGDFKWFHLEAYHLWFLTDVLAVEAHRHPFIETLGSMYLMKLKYKGSFMNRAGSKWRELLVIALMPWLHKYRKLHRQLEVSKEESDEQKVIDLGKGETKKGTPLL